VIKNKHDIQRIPETKSGLNKIFLFGAGVSRAFLLNRFLIPALSTADGGGRAIQNKNEKKLLNCSLVLWPEPGDFKSLLVSLISIFFSISITKSPAWRPGSISESIIIQYQPPPWLVFRVHFSDPPTLLICQVL